MDFDWTPVLTISAIVITLVLIGAFVAGANARKQALDVYRRLLIEKSFRDLLPATRVAWESAARWSDKLSAMDEAHASALLRRAADASRRKADRFEAVRQVMEAAEPAVAEKRPQPLPQRPPAPLSSPKPRAGP